jgi:hypothetical protein
MPTPEEVEAMDTDEENEIADSLEDLCQIGECILDDIIPDAIYFYFNLIKTDGIDESLVYFF